MQCSKCKRTFLGDEEVQVEGKGLYAVGEDAVMVTDQAAVFCQDCDEASYQEETAGTEETQSNPGGESDPMEVDPYRL